MEDAPDQTTDQFGGVLIGESAPAQTPRMPAISPPSNLAQALAVPPPDLRTPEQWGSRRG